MEMECKFNLQAPEVRLKLPPNWTYGTITSLEKTFTSLAPMDIKRSEFIDCVANWLNGLLSKFTTRQGHLWAFQRAKYALIELQTSQQDGLRRLETFQKQIKQKWQPSRSRIMSTSPSSEESELEKDDNEPCFPPISPNDYLARRRAARGDSRGKTVAIKRSFGQVWNWRNRFQMGKFDERDFWLSENVDIQDCYVVKWRESSVNSE
jgi:hypothetical protein